MMVVGWGGSVPAWAAAPSKPAERDDGAAIEGLDDDEDEHRLLEEVVGATVVYPQERGEIQLNLEPSYVRRREDHLGILFYEVEIGATDWLQLELGWTGPVIRGGGEVATDVGVGDLELGTQLTWMRMRGSPFSGAVAFETNIPLGRYTTTVSEGVIEHEAFVTFAVDSPTGRAQVFTNVGAELSAEEQARPFINAGVIGAAAFTRPYLVVSYSPEAAYFVPGVSLVLPKGWEVIAGVAVGLSRISDPIGVGLILVYEFNPLERRGQ
jgi:hypothetical protein